MKFFVKKTVLKLLSKVPSKSISFSARTSLALLALAPSQMMYASGVDSVIKALGVEFSMGQADAVKELVGQEIDRLATEADQNADADVDAYAVEIEKLNGILSRLNELKAVPPKK